MKYVIVVKVETFENITGFKEITIAKSDLM